MSHLLVTAVGADRPGIVAAVTGVLFEQGCNLEDTSMSILRGHFAMMLIVAAPEGLSLADLEGALAEPARALELVVAVRPIGEGVPDSPQGVPWVLSVYGSDRPGIVHRFAEVLAQAGTNVIDLTTRVIGEADRPVYAMVLDLTVPPSADADVLDQRLQALAAELGVDCSFHASESDVL